MGLSVERYTSNEHRSRTECVYYVHIYVCISEFWRCLRKAPQALLNGVEQPPVNCMFERRCVCKIASVMIEHDHLIHAPCNVQLNHCVVLCTPNYNYVRIHVHKQRAHSTDPTFPIVRVGIGIVFELDVDVIAAWIVAAARAKHLCTKPTVAYDEREWASSACLDLERSDGTNKHTHTHDNARLPV